MIKQKDGLKQRPNIILPALMPGDSIGLVAPAGPVSKEQVSEGLELLNENGFSCVFGENALAKGELTSASSRERINDLQSFLKDDHVKAIWSLRGGYGSVQLLDAFDFSDLLKHPKIFIGFSDVTAFQWAVYQRIAFPSISGFALTLQFSRNNPFVTPGKEILMGKRHSISKEDLGIEQGRVYREGKAEGTLIGGTLSMICSLCGTPYFLDKQALVLFIEDINEPLYRIDRCFQQLKLMGFWKQVKGVILGKFLWGHQALDVVPLLLPLLEASVPIVYNFPYGHITSSMPLPMGVKAVLNAGSSFQLSWKPFIGCV